MKTETIYFLLLIIIGGRNSSAISQSINPHEEVVFSFSETQTTLKVLDDGSLSVNISPQNSNKIKTRGVVHYRDFGAVGDGKTDDINPIAAAHAFANLQNLRVAADNEATYYIGPDQRTAIIQTDTDFGSATFIIDDTAVENNRTPIFRVSSPFQPFQISGIKQLNRNQTKIKVELPGPCLITVVNDRVKRYIRYGLNQNNGSSQTDIFVVDQDGNIDQNAPLIWDFDHITKISALPIDEKTTTISGGHFITIANQEPSRYNYYQRNLTINRSNVFIENLRHSVKGEGETGAPYGGFFNIRDCAYVTIKNCVLTGHKTYKTIGSAGKPVSMGSYDISLARSLNVSFINCSQTNDINDRTYWGIMGSNYCKNLLLDGCTFSRFDAHQGVANATIRRSTLGHMGIKAIGSGLLTVEKSTVRSRSFISLRPDYGSTWQGEIKIIDCIFIPSGGTAATASILSGTNTGQHDFGYICYMPEKITIENLHIDDTLHPEDYEGTAIFSNFNPQITDDTYEEQFPYILPKEVILKNVTTSSGVALRVSKNPFMFRKVNVRWNK